MQAKEFLSRHHVAYQSRDVENDPAAARELADLGFASVPLVVLPGRPPILGFNARELSAAIAVAGPAAAASPEAVFDSLDRVLAATLAAAAELDRTALDGKMPNRDRTLRELIHDIFYKALRWSDGAEGTGPGAAEPSPVRPSEPSQKAEAARYPDAAALVRYGETARAALRRRLAPENGADYGRFLATPDGPMTTGDTVAWLASHSAFHLRQLYRLMEDELGMRPRERLDIGALPGVALPADLW